MIRLIHICIWLTFLATSNLVCANDISINDIQAWAQKKPETKSVDFYSEDIQKIGLTNKDIAYLVPISLNDQGRNGMFQTALAIPSREEVILLTGTEIKDVEKITDVDSDGISEIYAENTGSGQGTEMGEKSLVQIDKNGKVIVLRKAKYETNDGVAGKRVASYYQKDVSWVFVDSSMGDDIKDLIETITIEKGRNNKDPIINKTVNRYHFINAYLFKYEKPETTP